MYLGLVVKKLFDERRAKLPAVHGRFVDTVLHLLNFQLAFFKLLDGKVVNSLALAAKLFPIRTSVKTNVSTVIAVKRRFPTWWQITQIC